MNSILLLTIGTAFGLISSLYLSSIKQKQTVTLRFIEQFFEVRKEIVDVLSKLSDLDIYGQFENQQLFEFQEAVSKLYYKHYDFVPPEVVESLLALHACLKSSKGQLYQVKDGRVVPMSIEERQEFILKTSRFRNTRIFATHAFNSPKYEVRRNLSIKLHAQFVLYTLNSYVVREKLLEMTKNLKKEWPAFRIVRH